MRSTLFSLLTMVVCSSCSVLTPEPAEPQSATAEVLQSLEKKCEFDIKRTQTDFPAALQGGPGFTSDTAWKILIKDKGAVSFEYLVLGRLNLGEHVLQALAPKNGRYYDMHLIKVEHEGKLYYVEQWFDITPYFKAM